MRHVLVTGGAAGIGYAIAARFHAEGDKVLICDVNEAGLASAAEALPGLQTVRCDVTRSEEIEGLFRAVDEKLGAIDVLVNNVGVGGPTLPLETLPREDWQQVLDVNLTATFDITQRAIPYLREAAGTIIVMSSAAGRFGYPNRIAYAVTKWGLIGFTKTLSRELGVDGISVNAIMPGAVGGERFDRVISGRAELSGKSIEETISDGLASQSLKQIVDPAHIADLALFLTTPSGRSISGQMLPIDCDLQYG